MGQQVRDIRAKLNRRVLNLRAIQRVVNSDDFEIAYGDGNADADKLIETADLDRLRAWVDAQFEEDLVYMPYRKLRELGKQHNIPYWSRLERADLICALRGKMLKNSTPNSDHSLNSPDLPELPCRMVT